jgi:hypothetical protein
MNLQKLKEDLPLRRIKIISKDIPERLQQRYKVKRK